MTKKILLGISLLFSLTTFGQTKILTEKDYAKKPYWIKMMDIQGVNYNEIVKAYTVYWKHHEMPLEKGDRYIGKGNQLKEKLSKKELKELRESNAMQFQVKKFEHWKIKNEPFIKENGNIMTPEERLKFHNQNP